MRSSVDLPDPLRPTSAIRSPGAIESSALSSSGAPPSVRAMFRRCRRGAAWGFSSEAARDSGSGTKGKAERDLQARLLRRARQASRKSRTTPI